jgi:multicomponent K+:H+ antiporter subunit C
MEAFLAIAIGLLTSCGVYLMLRARTFPVILGLTLLSYAVNLFLFASGRLVINAPPIIRDEAALYTDPIPQALVLTAIVIGFGMTAYLITLALRGLAESGSDHVDMPAAADQNDTEGTGRHA